MYTINVSEYGDLFTVEDFCKFVKSGSIINYDGTGYPVRDGKECREEINCCRLEDIPKDATHIAWYNK